ncbi:MAG: hypothetical protein ABJO67_03905 [Pseudoruegeria sp.]
MGDPLVNLRMFFVHSFRVQFDEPREIMLNYDLKLGNAAPEDTSEKRALHPFRSGTEPKPNLSCEDIEILGYEDWREGFENARQARAASIGNLITSDMRWPNFVGWNSPAYARISVESSILGNLISADVSIAVLGNDFDIDSVLDQTNRRLSDPTLGRVLSITGMGYDILYQSQLSEKSIQYSSMIKCDGFTIYNLEVR